METENKYIIDQYFNKNRSAPEIAEELGTYPNKIIRIIRKSGLKMRSKSDSQKIALEAGRTTHPTEGMERSDETKLKISESVAVKWQGFSDNKKEKIRESLQKSWKKRDPVEVKAMQKKAVQSLSKSGREGSKIEKFMVEELANRGYNILAHKKGLIPNSNLEPDAVLPDIKLVIELDGPTHSKPIFGQERLDKVIASDAEKNALFLQHGFCVLRIKYLSKTLSQYKKRTMIESLVEKIEEIKKNHKVTILSIEL